MISNAEQIKQVAEIKDVLNSFGYRVDVHGKCACPIHQGKNKNFVVKNNFGTCFSQCGGQSWDSIGLVMELKNCTYPEALEYIAKVANISIEYSGGNNAEFEKLRVERDRKTVLYDLSKSVADFYFENAYFNCEHLSLEIDMDGRPYNYETLKKFRVCYSGENSCLHQFRKQNQITSEIDFIQIGLTAKTEFGTAYDNFQNRILFPIYDEKGNCAGFAGRKLKNDKYEYSPKYLNSPASTIYNKGEILYGLYQNKQEIKKAGFAFLFEGYTDVLTAWEHGVKNSVAGCGTALTKEQAKLLAKHTERVICIYDGDEAGLKAARKNTETLLREGLYVEVVLMSNDEDPDSFLRKFGKKIFDSFVDYEKKDAVIWRILEDYDEKNIFKKEKATELAAQLLMCVEKKSLHDEYIAKISKETKINKKVLTDLIEAKNEEKREKEKAEAKRKREAEFEKENSEAAKRFPEGVSVDDTEEYGFYEYKNRYFMRRVKNESPFYVPVSNFTMRVLFLIQGLNAKRIVEITNNKNKKITLDFMIDELISIDKFNCKLQSNGNFLFDGTSADLGRIKRKLFDLEKSSFEVPFAGHHRDQFYTFSNGVFDYKEKKFVPLNDHKMVDLDGRHYFVPLLEGNAEEEENANYLAFQHHPTDIDFKKWSELFVKVYGDNGKVGLAFALMCIFLDVVKEATGGKYPMIFCFGQKGSGKTTMAQSLMCLHGERKEPPKLEGKSTPKSYMRQLAQMANSVFTLDEYKNSISTDFIGMLKGLHDGEGYSRAKMDNTNKTVSTPIRSTVVVCGQEMPNCEPALFSRFLLLEFQTLKSVSQDKRDAYDKIRALEDDGITSVLIEVLSHRKYFKEEYAKNFKIIRAVLRKIQTDGEVMERQMLIGSSIIAAFKTLESVLEMPFKTEELIDLVQNAINRQTALMGTSDEVQHFFETVAFLMRQGTIRNESEIKFKDLMFSQTGEERVDYTEGFFLLRMKYVYPHYCERLLRMGKKPLDAGTLERYLKSSSAFDAKTSERAHRFNSLQNPTNAWCFLQTEMIRLYKLDLTEYIPNKSQQTDIQ